MSDIYQEIWNADQEENGVKAIKKGEQISADLQQKGYVVVDERKPGNKDLKLIPEIHIPEEKIKSYRLFEAMLNNYTLDQTKAEVNFPEEQEEVQRFLDFACDTKPMRVAKDYYAAQIGETITINEWWAIVQRIWFEQFDQGNNKNLSGFEHILVGEQKQGKLQGYHFWYKYYLDENFRDPVNEDGIVDLIDFHGYKGSGADGSDDTPDVATITYKVKMFDYEAKKYRPLTKPIGGFWIGPSAEGLIAIGTLRCLADALAPKKTVINGYRYNLPMFRSANDRNLRTFYPEFDGKEQ